MRSRRPSSTTNVDKAAERLNGPHGIGRDISDANDQKMLDEVDVVDRKKPLCLFSVTLHPN
jgi:hypothetical protein